MQRLDILEILYNILTKYLKRDQFIDHNSGKELDDIKSVSKYFQERVETFDFGSSVYLSVAEFLRAL